MSDFAKRSHQARIKRSPLRSYHAAQQGRNTFRTLFKGGVVIGILCLSFLCSCFLIGWFFLHTSTIHGSEPVGIVLLTGPKDSVRRSVTVLWMDPGDNMLTLFSYPDSIQVRTPSEGEYSISSLYGLLALDHQPVQTYLRVMLRNIHINVSGVVIRNAAAPNTKTIANFLKDSLIDTSESSSLSLADRFRLWWFVAFRSPQIRQTTITDVTQNPRVFDDETYDAFVQKNVSNLSVRKENETVSVVNASGTARLATTVGRVLTTEGINVISLGDTPILLDHARLVLSSQSLIASHTVDMLSRSIDARVDIDPQTAAQYRSDIVLFLSTKEAADFSP
ncbi:hypothetical protein C5B42_04160 [Candidatus Cerribacteria bacterium 'Amazon FNV 2010 28 9']|uniref:LytR/CpsA/Psr regulator C-terminal domain-containing protein n=1 Tax=Candidatus Cerribacteria bacterium 'Amazon FNV 2010 28 9' TaxID=2081795 RepID=A0A317JPG0_9BACT|nr:MAG: hypothetical protein C5B42_04160 [Candidatus Cerribacteria bacterium 'Amazon FNV 2010 28 9']